MTLNYEVKARNTAAQAENKMHDDDVARTYGFSGGLVPGVDVYAYMTHLPAELWGRQWLEQGAMSARFLTPVYDGDRVRVEGDREGDSAIALTLYNSAGDVCARGRAALGIDGATAPALDEFETREVPARADRPDATAEALGAIDVFGTLEAGFHADHAPSYLQSIGESLDLYATERVAHPGWLIRFSNWVLTNNVRLGPWIHVSSETTHFGAVRDGDRVSVRGKALGLTERKGHKFVDLDVLYVVNDTEAVWRVHHTAIYEPRKVS